MTILTLSSGNNYSATVSSGTYTGVVDAAGTVALEQLTISAGAAISGLPGGTIAVNLTDGPYATSALIVNGGSILGDGNRQGIVANMLLTVSNAATGLISGLQGVLAHSGGSVTNAGTIAGQLAGVYIQGSGTVTGTVINTGLISASVDSGRSVWLENGGTVINSGVIDESGGIPTSGGVGVLNSSGTLTVSNASGGIISGVDFGVNAASGGTLTNAGVIEGRSAVLFHSSATVTNMGTISGALYAVSLSGGGTFAADVGAVENGAILMGGGTVDLLPGSGGSQYTSAGTISNISSASVISFGTGAQDADWSVVDTTAGLGSATISGFDQGDTIELTGFIGNPSSTATVNAAGQLVVGTGETITFSGVTYSGGDPSSGTDPNHYFNIVTNGGNTYISLAPCFLAGTRILTPSGETAVEDLREGDLVLTAAGEAKPVCWIGHRHVALADLADADLNAPVCIGEDAIAPGKPARDLWVTPDHAIFVGGRLIPVKLLVNGSTIRQVPRAEYAFYHIELDQHDLLLAEGLEAESYLDVVGSRQRFDNNPVTALNHGATITELTEQMYGKHGCHPISLAAEAVQPVWQALADRARETSGTLAIEWTHDAELHLVAGGMPVKPVAVDNGTYVFMLPMMVDEVTIASRAALPWQRRPWVDDRRRLGVAISQISYAGSAGYNTVSLDSADLHAGWHATEGSPGAQFRWTGGNARVRLPGGTSCVILRVTASAEYPLEQPQPWLVNARSADTPQNLRRVA